MPITLMKNLSHQYYEGVSFENSQNMASHGIMTGQTLFAQFDSDDFPPDPPAPSAIPVGHVDISEHLPPMQPSNLIQRTELTDVTKYTMEIKKEHDIKFETLRSYDQDSLLEMDSHMSEEHSLGSHEEDLADISQHCITSIKQEMPSNLDITSSNGIPDSTQPQSQTQMHHSIYVKEEIDQEFEQYDSTSTNGHFDSGHPDSSPNTPRPPTIGPGGGSGTAGPKTWSQEDMDMALDALKNHNMSLTKASATYGIPSTTLWQRAHRMGIDTPKKEGPTKSWTEENLNNALEALRTGTISANKASKAYGIPSSTLYKIARREGIKLAAPFNAAPTTWTPDDLEKALESIRTGQTSVQKASTEFGIPTGTLYGRCKREGIELSRSNPTPWSEDAMGEALEAVRLGHMSINQAAIHYNLPYSSLYGRFKRGIKYDADNMEITPDPLAQMEPQNQFQNVEYSNGQQIQYQSHSNS